MSTHKYCEALDQILELFGTVPELADVTVYDTLPDANPTREMVAVGTSVTFHDDWVNFGCFTRETEWTAGGFISTTTPGLTYRESRTRCFDIATAMARALVRDPRAVTVAGTLMWSSFRLTRFTPYPDTEGSGALIEFEIDGKARYSPND